MYICKFCNKQFSVNYQLKKGYTMSFCSKSCKSKAQRNGFQTKEDLDKAIISLIEESGRYLTKEEILSGLCVSSKTLNRLKVSTALLNKLCGMKKPSSVFEFKVMVALEELFGKVECQVEFEDLLSPKGYKLRFDFFIPSLNILVEADGTQHSDENHVYSSEYTRECDKLKNSWCSEKGIELVRIPYTKKVTTEYVNIFI